jgi:N-methylhydantoinase A
VDWTPGYGREFHRAHARRYGYADPARPTEVVAIRVMASGLVASPPLPFTRPRARPAGPGVTRVARFGGRPWPTRCYRWEALPQGASAGGPAILAGAEATAVVPPEFAFSIDGFGNVVMRRRSGRRVTGRSGRP